MNTGQGRSHDFALRLAVTLGLLVALVAAFAAYILLEKRIGHANSERLQALLLSEELRHSSDDLTRMARTFTETRDPRYLDYFEQIIDIRDGRRPRPVAYRVVYWDLVTADGVAPRPDSDLTVAFSDLLQEAGFTPEEMRLAEQARQESDRLIDFEREAIRLAQASGADAARQHEEARRMLHDVDYHKAKGRIMAPLAELQSLVSQRTEAAVAQATAWATALRITVVVLGMLLIGVVIQTSRLSRTLMGGPFDLVQKVIGRIGAADFDSPLDLPADTPQDSVLGLLANTRRNLAEAEQLQTKARSALEASENRFRDIAEVFADWIWELDSTGRFSYLSPGVLPLLQYAPQELIGRSTFELMPEDDAGRLGNSYREAVEQKSLFRDLEHRMIRKDGSIGHFLASGMPMTDETGMVTGFRGINRDVTQDKAAQAELEQYRQHLEELVAVRTAQLAQARDAAEAANRAKSTFLANMSHELRTPMNAILGMTHLLQRDAGEPAQLQRLVKLESAGRHLHELLNDILDMASIEAGTLELESREFHLGELMQQILDQTSAEAEPRNLALSWQNLDVPLMLRGDPARIAQALHNFAGNAVKFTAQGSVTLRTRLLEQQGSNLLVKFEVLDTGPGIVAGLEGQLFEPFVQLDASTTRRHGGSGLGLAITRRLARLMGGEAGVESIPDVGSTFWFTAHMRTPASAGMTTAAESGSDPDAGK
jgi:two-component system, sensor histidine kinase and response regulator